MAFALTLLASAFLCCTAAVHAWLAAWKQCWLVLQDVDSKMQQELDNSLMQCVTDIQSVIDPIQQLTAAEQSRLETALGRLDELKAVLEDLKQKAANVE